MSLGFEPTPTLLLILPVLLLLIAAILDYFFNKGKAPKSKKEITSLVNEHRDLFKNLDTSFAENIEKKLNDLFNQVGGSSSPGLDVVRDAKEFYESRIRDISAYARNPQAFGGYRLAEKKMPNDIIGTYESKIKQALVQLDQVQDKIDPKEAERHKETTKANIDEIKKEISQVATNLKTIITFEKEKFPEIEEAINVAGGEVEKESIYPLIPAALGILIGLYVIVTRPGLVFWFF
ncbi:MAG: hypothetical protein AB9882_08585 [Ignavibacteriaceae bacterium]